MVVLTSFSPFPTGLNIIQEKKQKQVNNSTTLSFWQLLKELRRHRRLGEKRHPMYEQSKYAKFFMGFIALFWIAYLVLFGVLFPPLFKEAWPGMEPYHILNSGMLIILVVDFLFRFLVQKLDAMVMKPYVLLPMGKRRVLKAYMFLDGCGAYNFLWWFMLVPFACITLWKYFHLAGILGFLIGYWLLMVMNNYFYIICRALINEHLLYILVPIVIFGLLGLGSFVMDSHPVLKACMELGEGFIQWEAWAFLAVIALIVVLFFVGLSIQNGIVDKEMSRSHTTKLKRVREYRFLDRFGEVGEFLRLEIKLITRNKVPKVQVRTGLILMVFFSLALAFSNAYDNDFMRYFIAIYNVSVLGVMVLSQCMMFEGNYLDGLMSRKESILSLLRAKYYLQCIICVIPTLVMIAPVIKGKLSVLDMLMALFVTTGFVFFIMFQLAVYNKSTMNLNQKVMGRNSTGNWFHSALIMAGFFLPIILLLILKSIFGESVSVYVLMGIGIVFTLAHPIWLRNVYKRFMKRRYVNMEGFRASRS